MHQIESRPSLVVGDILAPSPCFLHVRQASVVAGSLQSGMQSMQQLGQGHAAEAMVKLQAGLDDAAERLLPVFTSLAQQGVTLSYSAMAELTPQKMSKKPLPHAMM
jgi:hypothetical protein